MTLGRSSVRLFGLSRPAVASAGGRYAGPERQGGSRAKAHEGGTALTTRLLLILALLGGCAGPRQATVTPGDTQQLWAKYEAAVAAAKYPEASKISQALVPLVPDTPGLRWNDEGQVLMVTWTQAAYFPPGDGPNQYRPGKTFPLYGDTWFTAVPFARDFCRANQGPSLVLRLEQALGLPPGTGKDAFVEVWIDPGRLFRPCPDPEVIDRECQVRIPLAGYGPAPDENQPPWYCPEPLPAPDQALPQQGGAFATVSQAHLNWMCTNWKSTYVNAANDAVWKPYPWTALGYTFDWGDAGDPVGQSEFVALGGTSVTFHAVTPTEAYCR